MSPTVVKAPEVLLGLYGDKIGLAVTSKQTHLLLVDLRKVEKVQFVSVRFFRWKIEYLIRQSVDVRQEWGRTDAKVITSWLQSGAGSIELA